MILEGYKHVPTQSVSEDARNRTIAVYAPSKTFNLAGLVGSYHIIYNKYLRDRVVAKSSKPHYNEMNVLSMHPCAIRMNLALPLSRVKEAFARLDKYVFNADQ